MNLHHTINIVKKKKTHHMRKQKVIYKTRCNIEKYIVPVFHNLLCVDYYLLNLISDRYLDCSN